MILQGEICGREVEECRPRWRSPRPEVVSTAAGVSDKQR
jgi:hypothetical protein